MLDESLYAEAFIFVVGCLEGGFEGWKSGVDGGGGHCNLRLGVVYMHGVGVMVNSLRPVVAMGGRGRVIASPRMLCHEIDASFPRACWGYGF